MKEKNFDLALVELEFCRLTRTSVMFVNKRRMSFDEWLRDGLRICRAGGSVMWWIGGWVNAGSDLFLPKVEEENGKKRRLSDGELEVVGKYEGAMELTGLEYQTLMNAAWVDRAVAISRRRERLSWSHHSEVAGLEGREQERFLKEAEERGWTRSELRQAIRKAKAVEGEEGTPGGRMGFVLSKAIGDIVRWFGVKLKATPLEDMSNEWKAEVRRELRPLVDFYEALEVAIPSSTAHTDTSHGGYSMKSSAPYKESLSTPVRSR